MRQFKFRAWYKDWDGVFRMSYSDRYEEDEVPTSPHELMSYFFRNLTPEAQLMQYTGLKDKNGKEIYEGDILRVKAPYEGDDDVRNIDVRWFEEGGFIIEWSCGFNGGDSDLTLLGWAKIEDYQFEVIGNIYQNPELLKS